MKPGDRLLKFNDVVELLNVTPGHLRKMIFYKRVPVCRIGKSIRFRPAELEKWLAERSTPAREQ